MNYTVTFPAVSFRILLALSNRKPWINLLNWWEHLLFPTTRSLEVEKSCGWLIWWLTNTRLAQVLLIFLLCHFWPSSSHSHEWLLQFQTSHLDVVIPNRNGESLYHSCMSFPIETQKCSSWLLLETLQLAFAHLHTLKPIAGDQLGLILSYVWER